MQNLAVLPPKNTPHDGIDPHSSGFAGAGEFFRAVVTAHSGPVDPRLVSRAATVFGTSADGPSGAYAVPTEFADLLLTSAYGSEGLLGWARQRELQTADCVVPLDDGLPWGSTGITAAWEGEGDTGTQTKPELRQANIHLRKLAVTVPVTNELLEDVPLLEQHLAEVGGMAIDWKVSSAVINGTGAGLPLGIMASNSRISVAKESGQAAASIVAANVKKMLARCILRGSDIVWICHPDAYGELISIDLGNASWESSDKHPNGLLAGRPIVLSDACSTLGTEGDLILANMHGYLAFVRAGGVSIRKSMHVWFDQDLVAFRLLFRMDGQPALTTAVTPPNGSNTRSHFVTLATRA